MEDKREDIHEQEQAEQTDVQPTQESGEQISSAEPVNAQNASDSEQVQAPEQPTEQPAEQPAEQPIEQPAEQPAEQPTKQPETQPAQERPDAQVIARAAQTFIDAQYKKQETIKAQGDYRYKWNYEEQRAADLANKSAKRTHRWGMLVYALTMTAVFALCFGVLLGVLIHDAIEPHTGDQIVQGGFTGDVTVIGGGDEQTIEVSALESVRNYTVVITAKSDNGVSTGTGFVLTEDGYIATNYHVIEKADTITVKFYSGNAAVAQVVGYSEIDDIAVIKVAASGLYTARLGSSANVRDAQNVYAVGTPAGEEYAWSVTKGVVSFAQRDVKIYDNEGILVKKMKLIQTDTPVNPGNSGGPLVNSDGEVLGIVTLKLAGQYENMGFAIPIDGAMVLINNIIRTGEPGESPITSKRPLIGIVGVGVQAGKYYINIPNENKIQEVDRAYAAAHPNEAFYAPYTGIWVQSTTPGLDAANKLQPNDIIVLADGQELTTIYDLMEVINDHSGGETVQLTYYRNGVANIVDVELGYAD